MCVFTSAVYRKCETGEGIFMFDTKDPDAIFEQVQRAARAMARNKPDSVSIVFCDRFSCLICITET